MKERATEAYEAWQQADAAAREVEKLLSGAWGAYDMGGEPPPQELLAEVSKLRAIASAKLRAAVGAFSFGSPGPKP